MPKSAQEDYLKKLEERRKTSHVYSKHQALGLAIADMLGDREHKALYIKFAKEYNGELLLAVAKDISSRTGVKNKGAYLMKVFGSFRSSLPHKVFTKEKKILPPKPKQLTLAFGKKRK